MERINSRWDMMKNIFRKWKFRLYLFLVVLVLWSCRESNTPIFKTDELVGTKCESPIKLRMIFTIRELEDRFPHTVKGFLDDSKVLDESFSFGSSRYYNSTQWLVCPGVHTFVSEIGSERKLSEFRVSPDMLEFHITISGDHEVLMFATTSSAPIAKDDS